MIKVVIVLDKQSKRSIKIDSSVLSSDDITVVNSLLEIKEEYLDDARKVIVLEGMIEEPGAIQDLQLFKQLGGYDYLILLNSDRSINALHGIGQLYVCDYSVLDFSLVQAAIYNDNAYKLPAHTENSDLLEYAKCVRDGQFKGEQDRELAEEFLQGIEREKLLKKQLSDLQEQVDSLAMRNSFLENENKNWSNGCKELVSRIKKQNGILERYESVLSADLNTKLVLYDYPNKPTIVYLKVLTDFAGINTLIEVISDAFKYQAKQSVKVLQLFDGSGERKLRLLPDYYHRIRNRYTIQEVIKAPYVCKSGDYFGLLDKLLTNKYGLDVLVIVDNKAVDDTVFVGSFLQYNLCKTIEQAEILGLSRHNTVVNSRTNEWTTWIPSSVTGLSKRDKFIKLSSRKVIQNILTMSEKYANSF